MAAPANDRRSDLDSPSRLPFPTIHHRTSSPPTALSRQNNPHLPQGPCNYRDLSAGSKPPACGCRRFWLGPDLARIGLGLSQTLEPWCACGHHACYHERKESRAKGDKSVESSLTSKESLSQPGVGAGRPHYTEPTQPWLNRGSRALAEQQVFPLEQHQGTSVPAPVLSNQAQIPSFHLTSSELRGYSNYNASVGLGLDFQRGLHADRKLSQSPTVPDTSLGDDLPSTRQPSTEDHVSPSGAFMRHILNARQDGPRLDTTSAVKVPVGLGFADIIQSATEVATPSVSASPRLTSAVELIQEAADVVGILEQGVAAAGADRQQSAPGSSPSHRGAQINTQANSVHHSAPSTQTIQEALRQVPAALQRLAPLLGSLQTQFSRNPDISIHESINSLVKRMDALENVSFNQLPPEQIHDQFQHIDVRLTDLEARTDEHDRLISALDDDFERVTSQSRSRRLLPTDASFASHRSEQSLDSATSSALIAAAIDRVEATERLRAVEERLDTLEALQMPSLAMPWEVEVVLLPWGRDLHGVWYNAADLHKTSITQDDENWTQARNGKPGSATFSQHEPGPFIPDWAAEDEDHLAPKACGVNSIAYHRLRSRGLVRKATLTSPGARDFVVALIKAFGGLLETISTTGDNDVMDEDGEEDELFGLTAPFLPLRKIHKSSCLRFLAESELFTPALWTMEFLAAGVIMRASAGRKRLFITTRSGYTQGRAKGWTWSALRQLPRVHDPDSQEEAENAVREADALEPCWKYHAAMDGPPSAQTSFHSNVDDSGYVEARALTQVSASEIDHAAITGPASSPLFRPPITPISEFPATQTSLHQYRKSRTLSTSLSDAALPGKGKSGSLPQPTRPFSQHFKRPIRSFEQSANPALIAALPSFVPSSGKGSVRTTRIKKRRRITRSKSASPGDSASQSSGAMDAESLHPEADPEQVLQHLQYAIPHGGAIMPLGQFEPRARQPERQPSISMDSTNAGRNISHVVEQAATEKRGVTPSAYATPFSGTVSGAGDQDDDYMPSESGEDDWAGVDGDQFSSNTDEHEIDDDMSDEESEGSNASAHEEEDDDEEAGTSPDELHGGDEDDEMLSSEDELQLE